MGCEKKVVLLMVVVFCYALSYGGIWAQAQVHHVVGDDHGWDLTSDIASWAAGRSFSVGDFIWFAYSGGIEMDNLVELKSKDEFESCDLRNPIKMFTDGIDKIPLQEEGIRYFASSNAHSCKKGLKLHVDVKPKSTAQINQSLPSSSSSSSEKYGGVLALEPSSPSSSTKIYGPILMIICGLILGHVGF